MKKIKKLMAALLAMVMMLAMTTTAFAAGTAPSENDKVDVQVSGVEAGATVTAYQIIKAKYNGNGFVGYEWATETGKTGTVEFKDGKVVGLTSDFITELAKDTSKWTEKVSVDATGKEVTLNLKAGTYMVLVTPPASAEKVYNPMIVSAYYSKSGSDNTMTGAPVDANDNWKLEKENAYAKSTAMTVEKDVDQSEAEVGQTVNFTLKDMVIPSYSEQYTEVKFDVTDTIVNGLEYTENEPVVKVGGVEVTKDTEYTLTYNEKKDSFTVSFKQDFIKGLANKSSEERKVEITYSAKVTEDAIVKVGENKVEINYSTQPGVNEGSKEDTEYTHTFELNGVLQKVEDDKTTPLAGAEFTLYRNKECTDVFDTYVTTEDGNIKFQGLDAETVYYLKETKAPEGFSLNDKVYEVEIKDVVKDKDGKVTSYAVYIDGTKKANITYGQASAAFGEKVVNTKLAALPGTGGIGTTIFTIGGCIIMIAAAAFYFLSRKKENN